jgi:hypothetical protein
MIIWTTDWSDGDYSATIRNGQKVDGLPRRSDLEGQRRPWTIVAAPEKIECLALLKQNDLLTIDR